MKVRELKELLEKQDPEEEVYLTNDANRGNPLTSDKVFKGPMRVGHWMHPYEVQVFQIYAGL
jgi:hypothetical protein